MVHIDLRKNDIRLLLTALEVYGYHGLSEDWRDEIAFLERKLNTALTVDEAK